LDSKEATESNTIFIVSGSPFGPVSKSEQREQSLLDGADNLLGYPGFLSAIVTYLAPLKHKNIVWLSGDPHLSCVSEITLNEGGAQASFLHVISSGLYAPITAINKNANSILWQGTVQLKWNEGQSLVFAAEQRLLTDHHQHFVRVDLAQAEQQTQLSLEAFDASGAAIKDSYYQCSMTSSREGAVDVDT
jgi:cholesterol oxidase